NQQTRMISTRQDIETRLSDELGLLMEFILATATMRANLEARDMGYQVDGGRGVDVKVDLLNKGLSAANNTTVTVEAYQGSQLITVATTVLDIPQGNSSVATVRVELEDGDYTLRTILEYPKRLQENSTIERVVLETHDVTVESTFLGASGGWGIGLLLLLIAMGVAFLYWAHRKGWWRPGMVLNKVMARIRPSPEA
ncbi:MAG: hypothetical protein JSW25_06925, partial [Thermoplasmata archaeon]